MPPKKYTMDDLDKKFDEKLSSVKFNLVSDLKKEIRNLATLSDKDKEIEVLRSQVTLLQNHVSTVKDALDKKVDELEQHGRRVCLRIEGVEHKVNEKFEEFLEKVINIVKESEAEIPESVLDRSHRIDPAYNNNDTGKKMQSIIARFTTLRHRTLFYANCKNIKSGARIRLDLSKDRYNLLVSARKRVYNYPEVNYNYADINCRLKVKLAYESHKLFESVEELNGILSNASEYFFFPFISEKYLCLIFSCQLLLRIYFFSLWEHH